MGAVLFYHPQPQHNFLTERTTRYGLFNSLGVIVEDAIVVAILILGGILEACPGLKVCIAHGGGPACYAMGRLDRGWHGNPDARQSIPRAAEQLPEAALLRHGGGQRGRAPLPDRPGRDRPRGPRQRLALRAVAPLAGHVGAGPREL